MIAHLLQTVLTQMDPDEIARYSRHSEGPPAIFWVMYFGFMAVMLVGAAICGWKIFQKAGQPGWAALIPIYNQVIILQMIGQPIWWIALLIFPCTAIFVGIYVQYQLVVERFGQSVGFFLGTLFLAPIFIPMLAFGSAQFTPPPYRQNAM